MDLILLRSYHPKGVNGELWYGDTLLCYTIELPWRNNLRSESCIPEGKYKLRKRFSSKFRNHLELIDVENRSLILIHPANTALVELRGCIAPVKKLTGIGQGIFSKMAQNEILDLVYPKLELGEDVVLTIKERG